MCICRRKFLVSSTLCLTSTGVAAFSWKQRWKYIVIHHSAGSYGNIPFLQKVHRQRQAKDPIDAIPYHYIIGNGNGLGVGEIASDWRQTYGVWGAHVSANNPDKNFRGIGICLIGNYERNKIPAKQYQVLVSLTKQLMKTYRISVDNVMGHGHIKGEAAKCPGKHFPMKNFKRDIA